MSNISKPESFLRLIKFDIENIKHFIDNLSVYEWNEWPYRQNKYEKEHKNTQTYPLVWSDDDNLIDNTEIFVIKKNIKSEVWEYITPILDYLCKKYNGIVIKCMFVKLHKKSFVLEHKDYGFSLTESHRIHIPIKTNKNVMFYISNVPYNFEEGYAYEINNQKLHSVKNNSNFDRIHLIIDILPKSSNIKVISSDKE